VQIKVVPKNRVFLHGKAGVITMADGRRTSFLGSINESRAAFAENYEILWEDPFEEVVSGWRRSSRHYGSRDTICPTPSSRRSRIAERIEVTLEDLPPKDIPAATMVESLTTGAASSFSLGKIIRCHLLAAPGDLRQGASSDCR
jgi:hypothetical protein